MEAISLVLVLALCGILAYQFWPQRECECTPAQWDGVCPPPKPTVFGSVIDGNKKESGEVSPFWASVKQKHQLSETEVQRLYNEIVKEIPFSEEHTRTIRIDSPEFERVLRKVKK